METPTAVPPETATQASIRLLAPRSLQDRLQVGRTMVYHILKRGIGGRPPLRYTKIGKSVRVAEKDLIAWLKMDTKPTI